LIKRVFDLEDELITLTKNKSTPILSPNITKDHLTELSTVSTQTIDEIAREKVEIEVKERR